LRLPPAQAVHFIEHVKQEQTEENSNERPSSKVSFLHNRYILITPGLESEASKILELLHPYIAKFRPMIGFSAEDAVESAMVLAVFPDDGSEPPEFEILKNNGSLVKIIHPGEIPAYLKELDHAIQ
jgi:hypothetical protein